MTPDHGELLYEGKAKRVFASTDPDRVLVEFKNDATAFNAQKKAQLDDKGRLNCQISARLFELLEREGVTTHYCGLAGETWMLVRRVEIIPLDESAAPRRELGRFRLARYVVRLCATV